MDNDLEIISNDILKIESALSVTVRFESDDIDGENDHKKLESDLAPSDIAFCIICSIVSVFVTTSEDVEKGLAEVHEAANGQSGQYDLVQTLLGKLLHHKGDAMDMFSTRDGDDPYRLFHRLFFGCRTTLLSIQKPSINDTTILCCIVL